MPEYAIISHDLIPLDRALYFKLMIHGISGNVICVDVEASRK